jgi:hypothetical protein
MPAHGIIDNRNEKLVDHIKRIRDPQSWFLTPKSRLLLS